jgi:hypothetical protein
VVVAKHIIRAGGRLGLAETQRRVVWCAGSVGIADVGRRTLRAAIFGRAVPTNLGIPPAELAFNADVRGVACGDADVVVLKADFALLAITVRRTTFVTGKLSPLVAIVVRGVADLAEVTSTVATLGLRGIRTPATSSADVSRIIVDLTDLAVCAVTVIFARRHFFTLALVITGVFDVRAYLGSVCVADTGRALGVIRRTASLVFTARIRGFSVAEAELSAFAHHAGRGFTLILSVTGFAAATLQS